MTTLVYDFARLAEIDAAAENALSSFLSSDGLTARAGSLLRAAIDSAQLDRPEGATYSGLEWIEEHERSADPKPWQALRALVAHLPRAEQDDARSNLRILEALLTQANEDAGFAFDDLTNLEDGSLTFSYAPGPLAGRIVLGDGLTTFAGHGGSGKSTLAQALALDAMRAGRFVIHLDWEQGKARTARKYRQLGATDADLGMLGYLWQPGEVTIDRLHSLAAGRRDVFVLVDSFSKAASAAGLSGTDWAGHGDFASMLNAFGAETGSPVLLLDHLAKSEGKGARWADGAHGKYDAARGQWTVSVERPFRDDRLGGILLTCTKDNDSALDTHARFALGGDGPNRIELRRVGAGDVPRLKIERDVIAFLGSQEEPQTLGDIEKAVTGKARVVTALVKALAKDEDAPVIVVKVGRYEKYTVDRDHSPE